MLAGILAALCLGFAFRTFQRCREAQGGWARQTEQHDPGEERLLEQELNLQLNLARRNVQALGRVALFGGTGVAFWSAAEGQAISQPWLMWGAFGCGLVGWAGCHELQRRIGSLADAWRSEVNHKRRRQGVDPSPRAG